MIKKVLVFTSVFFSVGRDLVDFTQSDEVMKQTIFHIHLHLSAYLSIYLFIYLSIHPFIHPSISHTYTIVLRAKPNCALAVTIAIVANYAVFNQQRTLCHHATVSTVTGQLQSNQFYDSEAQIHSFITMMMMMMFVLSATHTHTYIYIFTMD